MQNYQNSFFAMLLVISSVMHGATLDEIREQRKNDYVFCLEQQIALHETIEKELRRVLTRGVMDLLTDSWEYGQNYPEGYQQAKDDAKIYFGSVELRSLMKTLNSKKSQCRYEQTLIPAKD